MDENESSGRKWVKMKIKTDRTGWKRWERKKLKNGWKWVKKMRGIKKNIKPAFLAAGIAGTHSRTSPQSEGQSSNLQAAVKVGENNIKR